MQQLKHPNVVAYLMHHTGAVGGTNEAANPVQGEIPWQTTLVSEFCIGGSLRQVLRNPELVGAAKHIDIAMEVKCIVGQIATGMSYLHSRGVIHGDLKASNVLLQPDLSRPSHWLAKISDFGTANILAPPVTRTALSRINGTVTHMAPELLKDKLSSFQSDVYSFAIVLWEIATKGGSAFAGITPVNVIVAVVRHDLRPRFPSGIDPALECLAKNCWCADPASRPSFDDIVKMVEQEWNVEEANLHLASGEAANIYRAEEEARRLPCDNRGGCDSEILSGYSDASSEMPLSTASVMSMEVSKLISQRAASVDDKSKPGSSLRPSGASEPPP